MAIINVSREDKSAPNEPRTFVVPPASTDYDMKANVAGAFTLVRIAKGVIVTTDGAVSFKLNSTSGEAIPLKANQSITLNNQANNIFFTSTPGATVTVVLL